MSIDVETQKQSLPRPDRLTATIQYHYEQDGKQPVTFVSQGSLVQERMKGGCYHRQLDFEAQTLEGARVRESIDLGWVEEPGLLLIKNTTRDLYRGNPSSAQLAFLQEQDVTLVTSKGEQFKLRPGLPAILPITPDARNWTIVARKGRVLVDIVVMPIQPYQPQKD